MSPSQDLVAPGFYLVSSAANEQCTMPTALVSLMGTSMATPVMAGAAALVRQYFADGFYPTGKKTASDGFSPSAALVKAMLVSSASLITGDMVSSLVGEQTSLGSGLSCLCWGVSLRSVKHLSRQLAQALCGGVPVLALCFRVCWSKLRVYVLAGRLRCISLLIHAYLCSFMHSCKRPAFLPREYQIEVVHLS